MLSRIYHVLGQLNVHRKTAREFAYGEWEVGVVLEEHSDRLAEVVKLERLDVVSSDQDLTLFRVIQACDELQYGAFPCAILPYYHLMRCLQ